MAQYFGHCLQQILIAQINREECVVRNEEETALLAGPV